MGSVAADLLRLEDREAMRRPSPAERVALALALGERETAPARPPRLGCIVALIG